MGTEFKAEADITRRGAPVDRAPDPAEDVRVARAAYDELRLVGMPRVNLLLAGRTRAVQQVLDALTDTLPEPVTCWHPGQPLVLPPADSGGTVVIHEVGSLRLQEQIRLLEWLAPAAGRTQVISTSAAPLFPRVQAGSFIDTLYYRLNTVYLHVTPD